MNKSQLPRLASHRFTQESMGSYHGISYADLFNPDGTPRKGVKIIGINEQFPQEIMVRTQDGFEVFFHWREDK